MFSLLQLVSVLVGLYGIYYFIKPKKRYNLAPGPWNIPFVSGIFKVGAYPHVTFQQWAKKYGPLISTKLGLQDALIIDDAKLIREAFNIPAFNGRKDIKAFTVFTGGKHGIVNGEGQEWAEQRRFVLRSLRDFGFGKSSMEDFITEGIRDFLKWMKDNEGKPVEVHQQLTLATLNFLWTIIAGEQQNQDDAHLKHVIDQANQAFLEASQVTGIVSLFPGLVDILPKIFLKQWYDLVEKANAFTQIFRDAIAKHTKNPVDQSDPRDFIDVYLNEVQKTKDPSSSFYGENGLRMLQTILNDLYGAAQATTPQLLIWSILYLSRYPRVQEKLQKELDAVIGRNRLPGLADKANLPYTEAFTMELHRHSSLTPFGLFHETTEDATLGGYDVKKGTVIIPNFYSVHYNEKTFGDPEVFRPERFLSADERKVVQVEEMMPFGTGKRQCLGETLGKSGLFLFLTSIFQRFEITPDTSRPLPSLNPPPGFFLEAEKFTVIVKDRIH